MLKDAKMTKRIKVKVKTRSSKNELKQISENSFEAKVTAMPEKGKANKKVIELIAEHFKTAKSNVVLISGESYREKVFKVILN